MTDINEPTIVVTDVPSTAANTPSANGMAGVVVVIGAFPTDDATIKSYTDLRTALSELQGDVTTVSDSCLGYNALPYLFNKQNNPGIEELLVVNITTSVEGVLDYSLTNEKLATALDLISDEHFNILFVASELDSTKLTTIKALRDEMYQNQFPWGLIAPVTITAESDVTGINGIFQTGGAYKLITTQKQLDSDSEPLTLVNTAAWDTAYTAGQLVNASETGKIIPGVNGLNTKEVFPDTYETILDNGLQSQKLINRRLGQVITNNIMTPTGRDMAIDRIKDYIVGDLALRDIFSKPNSNPTYEYIKGMFKSRAQQYKDLSLITDMNYNITECNSKCVKAELELFIPDIIAEVKLFVQVTTSSVTISDTEGGS